MKSNVLIAIALLALAGIAVPARAQEGAVVVTVPFEFVVGNTVLPAGKYIVNRTTPLADSVIQISSHDRGAFLLTTGFDSARAGNASLSFDQAGGEHVLRQITTPDGTYTIDNRQETARLTKLARSNSQPRANGMTSSGQQ